MDLQLVHYKSNFPCFVSLFFLNNLTKVKEIIHVSTEGKIILPLIQWKNWTSLGICFNSCEALDATQLPPLCLYSDCQKEAYCSSSPTCASAECHSATWFSHPVICLKLMFQRQSQWRFYYLFLSHFKKVLSFLVLIV